MKSDVPTAVLNGRPVRNTSAGIIRKPPPAPTNPVRNPIRAPSTITRNVRKRWLVEIGFFFPRIIGTAASTMRTAKIPSIRSRFVNTKFPEVKIISGMDGTTHRRVQKMLMMEGIPKRTPVRTFIKCWRYFGIAPAKLVTPTMNSE